MQMLHGTMKLTEKERDANVTLLSEYKYVIALGEDDLDQTDIVQHSIDTGSSEPVRQQGRRLPFHQKPVVRKLLDSMLLQDIIEPSHDLQPLPRIDDTLDAHYFSVRLSK